MSEPPPAVPATDRAGDYAAERSAERAWRSTSGGGVVIPLITTVLAFFIGGLVVARDRRTTRSRPTRGSSRARA